MEWLFVRCVFWLSGSLHGGLCRLSVSRAVCKGMALFSGRSGRPTFFTAVFNTFTPAIKESWVSSLQMAKLALGKTQGLS